MRKILLSVLTIGLVAAVAFGATRAYFSDTETVSVGDINAGTLDLKLDGGDVVVPVHVDDIKPGDTIINLWTLHNDGSLPGILSVEFSAITNNDNGCNDPETDAETNEYGAVSPGAGEGELGAYLRATVLSDAYGSLNLDLFGLDAWSHNNTGYENPDKTGASFGLNWLGGRTGYPATTLLPGDTTHIQLTLSLDMDIWNLAHGYYGGTDYDIDDNVIQSDDVMFDIIFHLDQAP